MRILLMLFLSLGLHFYSQAQKYEIAFTDLEKAIAENKPIARTENKLDAKSEGWESNAKIIITGTKAQLDKVTIKPETAVDLPDADMTEDDSRKVFSVVNGIKKKVVTYEILVDGKSAGKVTFDVANIDAVAKGDDNNNDTGSGGKDVIESYLGALASANFVGNNKFLANLTPVVNLGAVIPLVDNKKWFAWQLDVNPYVGAEIDTKDSVSFIPALMLYGRGGFVFNNYFQFTMKKTVITLMPFGFGVKFISNLKDSGQTVIQHNIRGGVSLRYADDFLLSAMVTHGWHNLTSESAKTFNNVFSTSATDISYVTVLMQLALRGKEDAINNYVYFEWRGLLSRARYAPFTNNKILTLGVRKTLELGGGFRQASSKKGKRIVRPSL